MDSRKILYLMIFLGLSVQLSFGAWASQDFDKCRNATIQGASGDLQDFPVPIEVLNDEDMLSDYSDLRFYSNSCRNGGQELSFEFEDRDSEDADTWVNIPELSTTGETISIYYDNSTPVSSAEASSRVWDSSFRTVQHMEDDVAGDEGSFSGSTQNEIFGQTLNGVSTSSTGIFDGAYSFDGEDDALNFSDNFQYSDSEAFTLDVWLNRTQALDGNDRLLGFDVNSSWGLFFDKNRIDGDYDLLFGFNESVLASNVSTGQDELYSASLRYSGDGIADIFVDGELRNSTSNVNWSAPVGDFGLAATGRDSFLSDSNLSFGGVIDEFRVSDTFRSIEWIAHSDQILSEESVNISNEVEYVESEIVSPSEKYTGSDVNLSVTSEKDLEAWKYSLDGGENRIAGLEGVFYTNSTSHIRIYYENGSVVNNFSQRASLVADQASLDSDRFLELPFVDPDGDLKVIDREGEVFTLASGLDTVSTMIGTGALDGEKSHVFYTDPSDSYNIKKVRAGESPETVSSGISANGVLGTGDFTGDGSNEVIFLGTSDTIKYLEDGTSESTGFSSFGSNNNKGLGQPVDINGSGQARVPYVTGSKNLALLDYQGNKYKLNSSYGVAEKTRLTAIDWKGDEKKELIHQDSSTGEITYMYYNGTAGYIGEGVSADEGAGLASANQHSINHTVKNLSEGPHELTVFNYFEDVYAQDSVSFTVDTSPPVFRNFKENVTSDFYNVDTANISAEASDQYSGLEEVKLATNETGSFSNKTSYGSPEKFENISDEYVLSNFLWQNESFMGELGYRLWASDAAENTASTSTSSFEVHRIDLEASNISFNNSDPIEGQHVGVEFNVTNVGGENATANVSLMEETYNGSSWNFLSNTTKEKQFEASDVTSVNFTVAPEAGPHRYTAFVDPNNSVEEKNESNNVNSSILDVPSYQLNYGSSNSALTLGSGHEILSVTSSDPRGTIFYADLQAAYNLRDLRPMNGSHDLAEATEALNMQGHNDSISKVYDEDRDGVPDSTRCLMIAGDEVCEVPVINSTNTSNFQTGLLYDGGESESFDGSQDVVFAAEIKDKRRGLYGFYNYEAKVPSMLSTQYDPTNFIDLRVELK